MIQKFIDRFMANKAGIRASFAAEFPASYGAIVKAVVAAIASDDDYGSPDVDRITPIDHGDYQGTLLFIVGAKGYQPSTYWSMKVSYGSCSGCDTLQAIGEDGTYDDGGNKVVSDKQLDELMTLALHLVQGMKEV